MNSTYLVLSQLHMLMKQEAHMIGSRGWPLANTQQETETLNLTAHMELTPTNNHMSFKIVLSSIEPVED